MSRNLHIHRRNGRHERRQRVQVRHGWQGPHSTHGRLVLQVRSNALALHAGCSARDELCYATLRGRGVIAQHGMPSAPHKRSQSAQQFPIKNYMRQYKK